MRRASFWIVIAGLVFTGIAQGQSKPTEMSAPGTQLVVIDTDIGDDVDDAYAVGLALQSPELKILGITTAWAILPYAHAWLHVCWKRPAGRRYR